jgi:hypothetical protein
MPDPQPTVDVEAIRRQHKDAVESIRFPPVKANDSPLTPFGESAYATHADRAALLAEVERLREVVANHEQAHRIGLDNEKRLRRSGEFALEVLDGCESLASEAVKLNLEAMKRIDGPARLQALILQAKSKLCAALAPAPTEPRA